MLGRRKATLPPHEKEQAPQRTGKKFEGGEEKINSDFITLTACHIFAYFYLLKKNLLMGNVNTIRVCIQIHSIFHLTKQHKIGYYILYYQSVQGAMI